MAFAPTLILQTNYAFPINQYGCCACTCWSALDGYGKGIPFSTYVEDNVDPYTGFVNNMGYGGLSIGTYVHTTNDNIALPISLHLATGHPVAVELLGPLGTHWVLAYAHVGGGSTPSSIEVMDPMQGFVTLQAAINRLGQNVKGYSNITA